MTAGPDRPAAGESRNPDLDPVLSFPSPAAWADWLAREHARSSGVWLKVARKGSGAGGVGYQEALDVALRYGWIDGRKRRLDDRHWLQRFTPRGPRSGWSKVNRERVERLIEAGEMRPAGLREVERAKADGRWQAAHDPPSRAAVPEDLERALAADERARARFATLDGRNRYAILHRIQTAKRPETRARRIQTYVAMLSRGETIYP
ncbi:MAG TPA: YdeI/OmpD-associated family protein [Candidatus Dormibacteraeota bacterium]|nr:YdeI/OmpD-associated family protein [Candidatus Dormibacteraeota bacterium]